jgi:hypothetical protein
MRIFVKSVMTGFAFSLGAALFRKVAPKLGLDEKASEKKDAAAAQVAQPESSDARERGPGPAGGSLPS